MKKLVIKSGVFILVFLITMIITGRFMNRGNQDMTTVMGAATLPTVTFLQDDLGVNALRGHTVKMDVSSMSSTIVQLGENREVSFLVNTYHRPVDDMVLEVRSCDGSRLIEQTDVVGYEDAEGVIRVETSLKDLLEKDTEYTLVVVLIDREGREIRYYTRCIWGTERYASEKTAFVKMFHEATFQEEKAGDLKKYMETNSSGDNTTLHKVNIHSSMFQLMWGDLDVESVAEPVIDILELGRDTGSFLLRTMVASGQGSEKTYYTVEEYYRIRYTADRVYLLDFERTMTELPDVKGDIYVNDKIVLGIVGDQVSLKESEDGNYVVFEAVGQLCSYDVKNNKLAILYRFYDEENWDDRTLYDAHGMKVLNIDETGNVKFAVYGYFNRGRHEGESGIGVYAFDSGLNTVEELVYLPRNQSWEMMRCDVEKLLYLNGNNKLYVYTDQSIHEVDIGEKEDVLLAELTENPVLHVSEDHRIVLWNEKDALKILDLETETETSVPVKSGERIRAVGFMDSHVIYGMIRDEDIQRDAAGREILPMYKIVICDSDGKVQKTYQEENVYTLSVDVQSNQITLNRVEKAGAGKYEEIVPEHIVSNEEQKSGKNQLVTVAIDVYQTITQIQLKSGIDAKSLQMLTPKEVLFEGDRDVILHETVAEGERYAVYNNRGVEEVYADPAKAVSLAYDTSGRVVDGSGRTVWYKGNRVTRNQIMAITEPEATTKQESLAVCIDTMLKLNGMTADVKALLEEGRSVQDILQAQMTNARVADLTGCKMDAMLYFVNKDIPVLAILADGEAVLITGFNEFNIVVFEPTSGKLYKKGLNDSAAWFEENGNCFITYFEKQ